jgi:hypothetical protein
VKSRFFPTRAGYQEQGIFNKDNQRRHRPVPMNDGSAHDHPLPLFLINRTSEAEQQGSSRTLKAAVLIVAALAIGAAVLTSGNTVPRLTAMTASLLDVSTPPQPDNRQPATPIESTADVQPSPATATDVSTPQEAQQATQQQQVTQQEPRQEIGQEVRQDVAAASEPADQPQTPASGPSTEALFKQFQAWAQDHPQERAQGAAQQPDTPTQATRVTPAESTQPARSTRAAKTERDEPAPVRTVKRHRHVRALQNARAEIRSARNAEARTSRARATQVQARPEDPRAQGAPAQNTQPAQPSALSQFFGWQ